MPFPPPGDLPHSGIELASFATACISRLILFYCAIWESQVSTGCLACWPWGEGRWQHNPRRLAGSIGAAGSPQRVGFGWGSWRSGNPSAGVARRWGRRVWNAPCLLGRCGQTLGLITGTAKAQDGASDCGEARAFRSVEPVLLGHPPKEPRAGSRWGWWRARACRDSGGNTPMVTAEGS